MVERDAKIRVYENIDNTFTLLQMFTPSGGSTATRAGAITDDHEWIVFGTWNSPSEIEIHKFNGSKYEPYQTISVSNNVRNVAITPDHAFLAAGTFGDYVFVYKYNGTEFVYLQNFTYTSTDSKIVSFTDDHQYLTVADRASYAYRYEYDET